MSSRDWLPRDGDTVVTQENLIFNVFGYEHPKEHVISFPKYIPLKFKDIFGIRFLKRIWSFNGLEMIRAEKLYTAENYQAFLKTFRMNFPDYVYFCPLRGKEIISVPLSHVKKVFIPNERLKTLIRSKSRDELQETAIELIQLISDESGVPIEDFGIHGSIALNMHSKESDIDFVIYGGRNFRRIEAAVDNLVKEKVLSYIFKNRLDIARRYKGRYRGKVFMYNAVRKLNEITTKYGEYVYIPIAPVKFRCKIKDDSEAMFRPAIYRIENYTPIDDKSEIPKEITPKIVVSMIGCYRNIARKHDEIEVSGMLERVKNAETGEIFYQVVVGTAVNREEYICPIRNLEIEMP